MKIGVVSWSKVGNGSRGKLEETEKFRGPAAVLQRSLPKTFRTLQPTNTNPHAVMKQ